MNIMIWLLLGGAIGWASLRYFDLNRNRGTVVVMVIGATGALLGGKSLAPMLRGATLPDEGLAVFATVVAIAIAAASVVVADMVAKRFDI